MSSAALLLAALALAGAPSDGAAAPPPPRPVLVLPSPNVDLGRVVEGESAVAVFSFENAGDADLRILSAQPG